MEELPGLDHPDWTDEQRALVRKRTAGYGEQGVHGFDFAHFRANLELTPTERIEKLRRALRFMKEIDRAGRRAGLPRPHRSAE